MLQLHELLSSHIRRRVVQLLRHLLRFGEHLLDGRRLRVALVERQRSASARRRRSRRCSRCSRCAFAYAHGSLRLLLHHIDVGLSLPDAHCALRRHDRLDHLGVLRIRLQVACEVFLHALLSDALLGVLFIVHAHRL